MALIEGKREETESKLMLLSIYVMRKVLIGTILGLSCANLGSELCATILRLAVQSLDCTDEVCEPQMKGQSLGCTNEIRKP